MPGEDTFDADLNAMLADTGVEQTTPVAQPEQTQPVVEKLKYGGREWNDPKELGKAYEAALKKMTQATQAEARLKPYGEFDAYLNKHPELRNEFNILWNAKVQEYQKRIDAGQSQATAQKATGVSQEVVERLERMEAHFEDQKLSSEISGLKSKFSLDKAGVDEVLNKAIELSERGIDLPLEDVYKLAFFGKATLDSKKSGEKQAIERMTAKKRANVGGSELPSASPGAKGVSEMSGREYDQAIQSKLDQLGYSG